VPAAAHVTAIKLTAGFTRKDKQGDLFAMNQRVRKVKLWRDGKSLGERTLDPDARGLQALAVDGGGGDYRIEIAELVAGTKPDWREVAISELEVWGTAPGTSATKTKPVVRVGSLDIDCVKALFPGAKANRIGGEIVYDTDVAALGTDVFACRVRHGALGVDASTVEIAVVRGGRAGERLKLPVTNHEDKNFGFSHHDTVELGTIELTDREIALIVTAKQDELAPSSSSSTTTQTVYRAGVGKLVPVLEVPATSQAGESSDSDVCQISVAAERAPLPDLDVTCTHTHERYPGNPDDHDRKSTEIVHYRWNGAKYAARP
jgi:hypothetical protein